MDASIPPGPGNSPDRNPGVVPTGRNMVVMNPEEVPSRPSWEIGKQLVDQLLAQHKRQIEGRYPEKVAFTSYSFSPASVRSTLQALEEQWVGAEAVGWEATARAVERIQAGPDVKEGSAAFAEKRNHTGPIPDRVQSAGIYEVSFRATKGPPVLSRWGGEDQPQRVGAGVLLGAGLLDAGGEPLGERVAGGRAAG